MTGDTWLPLDRLALDSGVSCPGRKSPPAKRGVRPDAGLARVLRGDHQPGKFGYLTTSLLEDVRELVTQQLFAGG